MSNFHMNFSPITRVYNCSTMMRQPSIPFVSRFEMDRRRCTGRFLFSLICGLLLVMPYTEYFWNFDKFLRGGQDLELGIFALLCFLCMVVVLARRLPREVEAQLAASPFSSLQPPLNPHQIASHALPVPASLPGIHLQI